MIVTRGSGWPTARALALQLAVLAAIALALFAIAHTTLENLDRLGIESGFDFLDKRAGFDVNQALFHYSSDSPVYVAFAIAICNTLLLAVLSIGFATLVGLVVALLRISHDWFLRGLGLTFIETFRNIPALLQIFFWYYVVLRALPSATESWRLGDLIVLNNRGLFLPGFDGQVPQPHRFGYTADLVITPELAALILGLTFYNASSVAEVIRAGFAAVTKGQWEAARSLGLGAASVLHRVIVPQALRVMVPPMTTCYLNIFKATSLGAAIGYPEIVSVMVGTTNNLVGRPVEIMFLVFSVYSLVSLLGIALMGWINRRSNRFMPA